MSKINQLLTLLSVIISGISMLLTGCSSQPGLESPDASTPVLISTDTPTNMITTAPATSDTPLLQNSPLNTSLSHEPVTQEIVNRSIAAVADLTTFKMDMALTMAFTSVDSDHSFNFSLEENAFALVDAINQQMAMQMDFAMDMPEKGLQKMSSDIFIFDGWMYMKSENSNTEQSWIKLQLTADMWDLQSRIMDITEFLPSATQTTVIGSDVIKGVDCWILDVTPDLKSLIDWTTQQMQSGQSSSGLSGLDLSAMSHNLNFSVKEWISKDSNLPMQQQISLFFETDPEEFGEANTGSSIGEMTLGIDGTFIYYDYGQSVMIQLPPAAFDATEVSAEK